MSFAINPSLNHINLPESYVDAFYRSTSEVQLPDARFRGHPCEAYICISKIEKTMKAYVAVLDMGLKSVLVYTSDYEAENPADYPKVEAEAQDFVTAMGFTMEKVNLDFSAAMREVIIKGFRVMRPPPPPKKQAGRSPKVEYSAAHHQLKVPAQLETALVKEFQIDELPVELTSLTAELTSARAVIDKLTREKISTEQNAILEIAALKTAVEQANEARRASEESFAQEIQKLKAQKGTSQPVIDDDEKAQLQAHFRKKSDEAKATEEKLLKEIAELQEKNRSLESEQVKIESLAAEKSTFEDKITALTEEIVSLKARISEEQAANLAAADRISALAVFEESWKEGQIREEELCKNIDLMQVQLDAMENELQQSHRDRKDLILRITELETAAEVAKSDLILKITELEAAAEVAKAEMEQLRDNVVDAGNYEELEAEKKTIEAEYVRLANESREKEIELSDALSSAENEVQRLSRELEIQTQIAAMEQSALRTELRRIVMGGGTLAPAPGAVSEPPVFANPPTARAVDLVVRAEPAYTTAQMPPAAPMAPAPTAPAAPITTASAEPVQVLEDTDITEDDSNEPDLPVKGYPEIVSGLINEFGSFYSESGSSSTEFSIDPSITSIEYSDPSEIVALLYSSNTVQAVPVGSSIQRCKGFVIGMMKAGSYLTYIIWYLTESKKSVICVPQQQPEDSSECIRTLQDAVSYFETVGFMMEFEELGGSTKSYKKALKKVQALKMIKN